MAADSPDPDAPRAGEMLSPLTPIGTLGSTVLAVLLPSQMSRMLL